MLLITTVAWALAATPEAVEPPHYVSWADLKFLVGERKPEQKVPQVIQQLAGRRVQMRGYIHPSAPYEKNTQFIVTDDEPGRTHGWSSGQLADEAIFVTCMDEVPFTTRRIVVEGVFKQQIRTGVDGKVDCYYAMEQTTAAVEPVADPATHLLKTFRDEFLLITPGEGKFPAEATLGDAAAGKTVKVKLTKPFHIAKYEVPQNLWEAVMGSNPSRWTGPRNSVEMLSLDEAREFCRKATEKMRAAGLITKSQFVRLPSEVEWEYTARAGTTTRYSFGDDATELGKYGWFTGNAKGEDPPVGAKAPNPWGLYDVHGYLWEWCDDVWVGDATKWPADGSPNRTGDEKVGVLRGGSWKDAAGLLETAYRRSEKRSLRDDAVGLRCVLSDDGNPGR